MKHKRDWKQAGTWFAALVVLMILVASQSRANTGTPSECEMTAMAAHKAAQVETPMPRNHVEKYFFDISRYLWAHAQGDRGRFLGWYREACEKGRVPRDVRIKDGAVLIGGRA